MILSTLKDPKMPSAPRFNTCSVRAGLTSRPVWDTSIFMDSSVVILALTYRRFLVIHDRQSLDLKHTNIYAYSYLNFLKNVTMTLGVSGDFTRGESPDTKSISQANPKFGITWNPVPNTTLRAAAFRVLKRTLITNATLEPTQVAGFNQFYDDFNGAEAWRYGAAVDQKFTKELFGGMEFSKRDLKSPAIGPTNNTIKEDMEEYLNRIYLFWTPHPWLALRTEYMFEQSRTEGLTGLPKKLNTHGVPLGINFFHPSGVSASLTGTYYHQDIKVGRHAVRRRMISGWLIWGSITGCRSDTVSSRLERPIYSTKNSNTLNETRTIHAYNRTGRYLAKSHWRFHEEDE